jgi:hypothetical protein
MYVNVKMKCEPFDIDFKNDGNKKSFTHSLSHIKMWQQEEDGVTMSRWNYQQYSANRIECEAWLSPLTQHYALMFVSKSIGGSWVKYLIIIVRSGGREMCEDSERERNQCLIEIHKECLIVRERVRIFQQATTRIFST